MAGSAHEPNSPELRILGELLRAARTAAGATTRQVEGFSSGHVSNVENGRVMPSRQFLLTYVTRFGCDRNRVMDAYQRAKVAASGRREAARNAQGVEGVWEVNLDATSSHADIRSAYRIRSTESSYLLGGRGEIKEITAIRTISPVSAEVSFVSVRYTYPTDPNPGVLSIQPEYGCSLVRCDESHMGSISAVLALEAPASVGGVDASVAYRIRVDSDIPAVPRIRHYASGQTLKCSVRVWFHESKIPVSAWSYRARSRVAADYVDYSADQASPLSSVTGGFIFSDFYDLDDEYCGVAWSWR
ncbi:helix-turn-helix domain-containing protein [Nocardiopsis suaedae]|uniref:Helix-turn-helix domain-containing protein n=1 Tax=Nocardiopsis suaedae TaxID=3018444 RepID=A0ABT4TEC9_9ACTN|nr:helix-turn-helix domain-containing protein [Nocardiopsis suaedae]MDA2803065.1 helix-turn-helix domain-containing protein [Nocardiopsis suaedae]